MSLIDNPQPGQFRAVCHMVEPHPISELPHYMRREYEEKGWKTAVRSVYSRKRRRDLLTECFLEPLCNGLETDDPAVYAEHMTEFHGGGRSRLTQPRIPRLGKGMWGGPRLTVAGKPWSDDKHPTRTCPDCGLVAEVDDRPANVLWWAEHQRGCEIAQAAS